MGVAWQTVHPYGKWLLVKEDPRPSQTGGGIVIPQMQLQEERVAEGSGRVLRVGYDVSRLSSGMIEPGCRVMFRGFLKDATAPDFDKDNDCNIFMLRAEDVLAILSDDVTIGVFSKRSEPCPG